MDRRHFLFSGLTATSLMALSPLRALANLSLADRMDSVAPMLTDNDEFPLSQGGRPDMNLEGLLRRQVDYNLKYWTSEEISPYLSTYLESAFEMFFLVNTDTKGNASDFVPFQHIKVIRRKNKDQEVFTRNQNGEITGLTGNAEEWALIPISSGRGAPVILTYSGLFRFNHVRTKSRIGTNESQGAPMSYSSYLDFVYNTGKEAGVALHGTPQRNWHLLGQARASEGCMRCYPDTAKKVRDLLLSSEMWSENLPEFNRTSQLPSKDLREGNVRTRPGIKAMLLIFNGYKQGTLA